MGWFGAPSREKGRITIRGPTSPTSFSDQGARGFLGCNSCIFLDVFNWDQFYVYLIAVEQPARYKLE